MGNLSKKRNGRVTASAVGAILGVNPYQTSDELMRVMVRQYHGAEREFTGNAATEHGHRYESVAIADYEIDNSCDVVQDPDFVIHPEHDWIGCTPDGLIAEEGLLEVKCPYYAKTTYTLDEKPMYKYQTYLQLVVTGRAWLDFYVWLPEVQHCERVMYFEAKKWFDRVLPELKAFYDNYLEIVASDKLSKPYLEDLEADLSDNLEWQVLSTTYARAKEQLANAKERVDEVKAELVRIAKENGKKCSGNGVMVYKSERKGNINYKNVKELTDVDLEQYRGKSTEVWTVK
jgi:putative phage-type endonuclease